MQTSAANKKKTVKTTMASKTNLNVLTEYEDCALIYRCTTARKTKLAKYTG